MVAEVLVELKAKQVDQTFTYNVPNQLKKDVKIGKRVLVPFGKLKLEGFILEINGKTKKYDYKLKDIIKVIDKEPVLNKELIKLGKYISQKTLSTLISSYQIMLPEALKAKKGFNVSKKYVIYLLLSSQFNENKISSKQQEVIINLIKQQKKVLKSECNKISISAVNTLLKNNLIIEEKKEIYRLHEDVVPIQNNIILTKEQKKVVGEIEENLNTFTPFLLHGITGSGKTEVYMNVIKSVLKLNKEAIVLVPEISLTPQMVNNFKNRFGNNIAIIHSRLSIGEKYDEWRKIERKEVSIAIGARSAIFAPFTNLGIIIVDEEHSTTYKQESTPKYSAIDIAIRRAKTHQCPLVLGSATPSIESYTRAQLNIYKLLQLQKRINNKIPNIKLIDMRKQIKKGYNILSKDLIDKINETLNRNEQIIIFLNRRGYSTVITCHDCGNSIKCPNCDIPLTYHKAVNDMKCHYCNYTIKKPHKCILCGSKNISQYGLGTQQLEEEIVRMFPSSKVIRMDVDTTIRKGSHEQIINDFKKEKYNILVGTQMISKGLDFEKVTLVGVLNGDASLNIPDFRSAERTFQLLNQVSGRAGRSKYPGTVIIQAFNQDHYSIKTAINNDYLGFYNKEMSIRKQLGYPPFYNLTLIKISGKDYSNVSETATKIFNYLKIKSNKQITILGPSPSNMPKINNVYYWQIVVKYKDTNKLKPILIDILQFYKSNNKVYVDIDINPVKI